LNLLCIPVHGLFDSLLAGVFLLYYGPSWPPVDQPEGSPFRSEVDEGGGQPWVMPVASGSRVLPCSAIWCQDVLTRYSPPVGYRADSVLAHYGLWPSGFDCLGIGALARKIAAENPDKVR
jgi:hypothetical protein